MIAVTVPASLSLYLALGAVVGGAFHAWVSNADAFFTRTTAGNVFIAAVVGLVYPLWPVIDFPETANVVQKAAIMAGIAYVAGDAIQNLLPATFAKLTGQAKNLGGRP